MDVGAIASSAMAASPPDKGGGQSLEEVFAQLLLEEVRKAMPEDGLMGSDEVKAFAEVFDAHVAKEIVASGKLDFSGRVGAPPRAAAAYQAAALPASGRVSPGFGHRTDPIAGGERFHGGMDIAAARGAPIVAARDGVVRFAGERGAYGRLVVVGHADGSETRYAHCERLEVRVGQQVAAGEVVGRVGDSGRATGPHLHFEVRQDGAPVDPAAWLRRQTP